MAAATEKEVVVRLMIFKFAKREHHANMMQNFIDLMNTAVKDGKPYILSTDVGPTLDNSSPDFTFAGRLVFRDLEDLTYYETECAAHKALKAKAVRELELLAPPVTVVYRPLFSASL